MSTPKEKPQERRRNNRVPVRIPAGVYLKSRPHDAIDAEILDISEGGAFVHCNSPIPLGTELVLEIRFDETSILEGKVVEHDQALRSLLSGNERQTSVVRWHRENGMKGFGIEFLGIKPEKKKFLSKLVTYFQQLQNAGVRFLK